MFISSNNGILYYLVNNEVWGKDKKGSWFLVSYYMLPVWAIRRLF